MNGVQAYLVDGVYIRITQVTEQVPHYKYLGFAKRKPFQYPGLSILEPGDVWFQFSDDPATLVDLLVTEVKTDNEEAT